MRHVVVYAEKERFAGWPANNGLWSWDAREVLVGFTVGGFVEQPGHNIAKPYRSLLVKSFDQGESWEILKPANFVGSSAEARRPSREIDFSAPGFAMRVVGTGYHGSDRPRGVFYISHDRGNSWQGPYSFGSLMDHPELQGLEFTSRTNYVIEGAHQCLLLMSARGARFPMDRVFGARTLDGGQSFRFVSWVVPPSDLYRAVMPATARGTSGRLISVIRRREPDTQRCWIDAYVSADAGRHWAFTCKVADTGGWNGNPPALTRLGNGWLCCVYGERTTCRMIAKYSDDEGRTWGRHVVLRADFQRDVHGDPDLGYARVVQRADGKVLALYYWANSDIPHQHIAATIWDPEAPQGSTFRSDSNKNADNT